MKISQPKHSFSKEKKFTKRIIKFKYEFQGSSVFSDLKIPKEEKSIDQKTTMITLS